jgi:hypothetical protein
MRWNTSSVALLLLLGGCDSGGDSGENLTARQGLKASDTSIQLLPFAGEAFDVLVDDADDDGRLDVILTSHTKSFTQVFRQTAPRSFSPGPRVEDVGYHPGRLIRLPGDAAPRYLMHAEGKYRVEVMVPTEDGGLAVESGMNVASPRSGLAFSWPGWGLSLAVSPFQRPSIFLFKDFDPDTGGASAGAEVALANTYVDAEGLVAADIDGDGVDEVLFATSMTHDIWMIRYPGEEPGEAKVERLWRSAEGGRPHSVLPVDIDGDGDIDLFVPDTTTPLKGGDPVIHLLLNQGGALFDEIALPVAKNEPEPMRWPGTTALGYGVEATGERLLLALGYHAYTLFRWQDDAAPDSPEVVHLPLARAEASSVVHLRDMDGGGYLDAVIGRGTQSDSGLILYGPLREAFESISGSGPLDLSAVGADQATSTR